MSNFDKAFASARKSGKSAFSFGGKSYNTKLASTPKAKGVKGPQDVVSGGSSVGGNMGKKRAGLPATVQVGPKRPMMVNRPEKSDVRDFDVDAMAHKYPIPDSLHDMGSGMAPVPSPTKDHPFFTHTTSTNRAALNDFKQSESRRSSDYSIGKQNAPKVKKAIGKFMLGKGYSD